MSGPRRAMILAAGRGERMRPLTDTVPKPMLEVGGRPLVAWHLEKLAAAGFDEVVINHAHLGQVIETGLGDGRRFGLKIRYSPEATALETAGGIRQALPLLGEAPFPVINGDVFSDFDFGRFATIAAQMRDGGLQAWCVLVDNPAHHPQGDFGLEGGRLLEDGSLRLTYSGIGVYDPGLFADLPAGARAPLAPLLREAARQGRAGAERLLGRWVDVGTPARLAELDAELRGGWRPRAMTDPTSTTRIDPSA